MTPTAGLNAGTVSAQAGRHPDPPAVVVAKQSGDGFGLFEALELHQRATHAC
jgi:hypothetical protein